MKKAIYKITNLINQKSYIGQSIHPYRRLIEHRSKATTKADSYPIHLAINKYGFENFSFEILEWTEEYNEREHYYINLFNTVAPNGYNILDGSSNNPVMYGLNNPNNTLLPQVVEAIIKDLQLNNESDLALAKKYNTTDKIISDINHGRTHRKDNLNYPIRIRKGRTGGISESIRKQIINDLKNTTDSYSKLATKYGVSKEMIGHINHGRFNSVKGETYPIRSK